MQNSIIQIFPLPSSQSVHQCLLVISVQPGKQASINPPNAFSSLDNDAHETCKDLQKKYKWK